MPYPSTVLGLLMVLTTSADGSVIPLDLEVVLRPLVPWRIGRSRPAQNSNRHGAAMDAATSFRRRNPLNAVSSGFILKL